MDAPDILFLLYRKLRKNRAADTEWLKIVKCFGSGTGIERAWWAQWTRQSVGNRKEQRNVATMWASRKRLLAAFFIVEICMKKRAVPAFCVLRDA